MSAQLKKMYDAYRVSPWLDDLSRSTLVDGSLSSYVDRGIRGLTSNPTIFAKAITQGDIYHEAIRKLKAEGMTAEAIYWQLAIEDIENAADLLLKTYEESGKKDGFVSIEVSPKLHCETDETVKQALWLHQQIDRPNLMIKVPATTAGLGAIKQLISQGVNVNVTLIFSLSRYLGVINAYLAGIEDLKSERAPASVASFFVSRVDSAVDNILDQIGGDARDLKGQAAISQALAAYGIFLESFHPFSERWQRLSAKAEPQRLLWASTSTKNPEYDKLKYISGLLTPRSVNTMPGNTIGDLEMSDMAGWQNATAKSIESAHSSLGNLQAAGIDMPSVADRLEQEGVEKFNVSFDEIITAIESV